MATNDEMVPEEIVDTEEAIAILRRLIQAFKLADTVLHSPTRGRIWIVQGVIGGGPPAVNAFDSIDPVIEHIARLRATQNADPSIAYWMHIFFGQRWLLQKGRVWQLWDGKNYTAITSENLETFVDESGSMLERRDPDSVLVDRLGPAENGITPVQAAVVEVGPRYAGPPPEAEDESEEEPEE